MNKNLALMALTGLVLATSAMFGCSKSNPDETTEASAAGASAAGQTKAGPKMKGGTHLTVTGAGQNVDSRFGSQSK